MTKSTITREESVQAIFDLKVGYRLEFADIENLKRVARMALAAMDGEPVILYRQVNPVNGMKTYWAELDPEEFRHLKQHTDENAEFMTLYRHAQPAPVVPAVSDDIGEIRVGRLPTMNQDDYPGLGDWWVQLRIGEDSDEVLARVYGATPQEANNRAEALACRAAMLQELKKSAGAGAVCRSSDNAQVLTSINPAPTLVSLPKNAKSLTGNSPVIGIDLASGPDRTVEVHYVVPPGYVVVPKEPTDEMIAAAMNCEDVLFNSDDSFCIQFVNIYEAMLAAAPKEVK
ncbi:MULTISPECIES: hypothetical protein [Klebsiella]|uniref:hypothetical protein n=1 Tax=Klebsiella pneumoniae complex TaxID=3390273 RepID=UPI000E2D0322|nr:MULTISPECIES: hypothetical protein [Klebsiella]SXC99014.1 Uncharacterised protein [Klebsiella quasipneumoniae]